MIHPTSPTSFPDPFAMLRGFAGGLDAARQVAFPPINMWQGSDVIALTAQLPGFDPEDVEISVQDATLTLSGESKPAEYPEDAVWHRNERRYGKFVRTIRLPYRVDPDKVEARLVNGILQIALHRPEQDKPRRIKITAA